MMIMEELYKLNPLCDVNQTNKQTNKQTHYAVV